MSKLDETEFAALVRAELPEECWVTRTADLFCTSFIGSTFGNDGEWTYEMCCLPCRVRFVLVPSHEHQWEPLSDTSSVFTCDCGVWWGAA